MHVINNIYNWDSEKKKSKYIGLSLRISLAKTFTVKAHVLCGSDKLEYASETRM